MLGQCRLIVDACVLAAAIRMKGEARFRTTRLDGHREGVADERCPHVVGHREADDPPARVTEVIGLLETLCDAWSTVANKSDDGPEANALVREAVLVA